MKPWERHFAKSVRWEFPLLVKQASADCPDADQLRENMFLDEKEVLVHRSDESREVTFAQSDKKVQRHERKRAL
jgi:hypothetical protein